MNPNPGDISMKSLQRLVIVMPVFNDWELFGLLLKQIDFLAKGKKLWLDVVAIDDGSTKSYLRIKSDIQDLSTIRKVNVIRLARNLGHQKAIAIGLAFINDKLSYDAVIVMDSDGEDQPQDIFRLLDAYSKDKQSIIFALRQRRSEGIVFGIFYFFYRFLFDILTGKKIAFGNFCLIPEENLQRVVYFPQIWNHFAAGIVHAGLPWKSIPTDRGQRFAGKSKMNFVSLIIHGLSAISVFIEILAVRLMLFGFFVILLGIIGLLVLFYIRYLTPLAIPGWATTVAFGLTVIMFQAMTFLLVLLFLVLNSRSNLLFVPAKHYKDYFMSLERLA